MASRVKAGRDFGDAGRAGDDDGLVQDEEDEEDDRADGEIAPDHEFSKCLNDFAGREVPSSP
jgi:hypothetical protein